MSRLPRFAAASLLVADDVAQLNHYRTLGYFAHVPDSIGELSAIVAGANPGRRSLEELVLAVNLGLALEDVATARLIYEAAQRVGCGTRLPL